MEDNNKRKTLNLISVSIGKDIKPIRLHTFQLPPSLNEGAFSRMKTGLWVLCNTLPWYADTSKRIGRCIQSLKLTDTEMLSAVRPDILKGSPLFLCGFPTSAHSLHFIHVSALPKMLESVTFLQYYSNPRDIQNIGLYITGFNSFALSNAGVNAILADNSVEKRIGRPVKPLESLSSRYAKVKAKGMVDTTKIGKSNFSNAKERSAAANWLLHTDSFFRASLMDAVDKDKSLQKQLLSTELASNIAHGLAIPVWQALLAKDKAAISDDRLRLVSGKRKSGSNIFDTPQYPRAHEVKRMRTHTNEVVRVKFGIQDLEEPVRAVANLEAVCRAQFYGAIANGFVPNLDGEFVWKLTFDGTDAGGKSLLAFGVVPMSLGVKVQSSSNVFPIGVGWVEESAESLQQFIPDLTEAIAKLHDDNLAIATPFGDLGINIRFDIAADMCSLWKLTGIGSASCLHSCIYCPVSRSDRQHVGAASADLYANGLRSDLKPIFGIPATRIHICSLHALTRITEKIVKMLCVKSLSVTKASEIKVANARAVVKNRLDASRLHAQRGRLPAGRGDPVLEQLGEARMSLAAAIAVQSNGGSVESLAVEVVTCGVLQKTFNVKVTEHKKDDGYTVDVSTLTGVQCLKLLGLRPSSSEMPPYIRMIVAGLGVCGHDLPNAKGSLEPDFCFSCNCAVVFQMFAKDIYPVVSALSMETLHNLYKDEEQNKFTAAAYDVKAKAWGALLVHTFYGGGSRSIISDYIHMVVDHSAYLLEVRGPLGFWSQQSFEAAHKVLKETFSRSTSHDGGREGSRSAPFQIICKLGRVLVNGIRHSVELLPESEVTANPWINVIMKQYQLSDMEETHNAITLERTCRRIYRQLPMLMETGRTKRLRMENAHKHAPHGVHLQELEYDEDGGEAAVLFGSEGSGEEDVDDFVDVDDVPDAQVFVSERAAAAGIRTVIDFSQRDVATSSLPFFI